MSRSMISIDCIPRMPEFFTDAKNEDREANGLNSKTKKISSESKSHISLSSGQSPHSEVLILPEEAHTNTSIEKLYANVCEMQSSGSASPSRLSSGSDCGESRIDSELCHLVGTRNGQPDMAKNEEEIDRADIMPNVSSKGESVFLIRVSADNEEIRSPCGRSLCSANSRKSSVVQLEHCLSDGSHTRAVSSNVEASIEKQNDKDLKRLNTVPSKKQKNIRRGSRIRIGAEASPILTTGSPDLGPFLLKHARDLISSGDNLEKALAFALRAAKSLEICADGKSRLELVMTLHVIAAIYCRMRQYTLAIPFLERSIKIPIIEEGHAHALAKFAGYMQLGDTYSMLGKLESSIRCYTMGLEIQKKIFGETDLRVGETCRYLAEAHVQALHLDDAQHLCKMTLDIHREANSSATLEEASDRRLMALICGMKGDHEAALEHLVLASMTMAGSRQEKEVASVDCSIGNIYLSLARYDEAIFAYQKALTVFKSTKGENHPSVASVLIHLANLYNKTGKLRESRHYCENALQMYKKVDSEASKVEVAAGLVELSYLYESMNEPNQAVKLLLKALKIYNSALGQQHIIAAIEAQLGVLHYRMTNYSLSYSFFKNAIAKLQASGEKSAFYGIILNQLGLVCIQRLAINEAADLFEEAKSVLDKEYGPYHPDTLGACSNLAGTYDALGRLDDAIDILDQVVMIREEKLGIANPDGRDERNRLAELLKEAGRVRNRKPKSLETLLDTTAAMNDHLV